MEIYTNDPESILRRYVKGKTTKELEQEKEKIERSLKEFEGKPVWIAPGEIEKKRIIRKEIEREIEKRKLKEARNKPKIIYGYNREVENDQG